jgi:predicted acylesterase/phospholipase RssA
MRDVASVFRLAAILAVAALFAGCATAIPRQNPPNAAVAETAIVPDMAAARFFGDEVPRDVIAEIRRKLPNLVTHAADTRNANGRPIVEYLALSGGGSDGAFGAGLLAGWSAHGTRPQFEVVTGVSAGAIIAPFAFLGPAHDRQLAEIWTEYGTSELLTAQILPGLLGGPSLADTSKLAELVARYVDRKFLRAVAAEYRRGRILLIGTTNLDLQRPIIWNMGEIAASNHPQAPELFHKVIMASAAIPGAFPPVNIPVIAEGKLYEEMHVDGGVTREVFIAPTQLNLKTFDRFYAAAPIRRIYIVKNGKLSPEFEAVQPTAINIAARSITTLTKSQSYGDIYRIWRTAVESDADFNVAAIPAGFAVKAKQAFDPEYQRALYQVGFKMGRGGVDWAKLPPEVQQRSPLVAAR